MSNCTIHNHTECTEHSAPSDFNIAIACLEIFLIIVILFGNILVVVAITSFKQFRTSTYYLIASLAIADICVAIAMPFDVATYFYPWTHTQLYKYLCLVDFGMSMLALASSVLTVFLIAVDRFVAVMAPIYYTYTNKAKPKMGLYGIAVVWVYSCIIAILPIAGMNNWAKNEVCRLEKTFVTWYYLLIAFHLLILSLIVVTLYGFVFYSIYGQRKKIQATSSSSIVNASYKREIQTAKFIAIILGCYIACWIPFDLILITQHFFYSKNLMIYKPLAFCLAVSHSAINPIIYFLKNRQLRTAFRKILKLQQKSSWETTPTATVNSNQSADCQKADV
ncbi:adenosine receptor A1-like [Lineus longissimus]|uniref:adenosine receptor A1-like n=1 Tax=Lineus longissimus TaxID=88925 RepID=UPI00315D7EF5